MTSKLIVGALALTLFMAAMVLSPASAVAIPAGEFKVAYVDIQRALNECHNGKEVKTDFRGRIERLQERLQGEQAEVERLKKELEDKGTLMQPDQRQNLEDDYAKKLREFQDDYKNSGDELKQKDNEMTGAIVQDLALVVQQIGVKNNYTMVMEKGSLLWAIPSIDITDEVIRSYDAMNVKPGALAQETLGGRSNRFGAAAQPATAPEESAPASGSSTITK